MKYIDKNENLRKLQLKELEILNFFDKICKKNNITYYLEFGTLLGAVRHKGFIPWDDDLDVVLKGEEYLKLYDIMEKEKNDKYFFQSLRTEEKYYLLWNKIRLNGTFFVEKGWENNEINNGIFIDIFPLLEYPDTKLRLMKTSIILKLMKICIDLNANNTNRYNNYGMTGKILYKIIKTIPRKKRNKFIIKQERKMCLAKYNSDYYFTWDTGLELKLTKEYFNEIEELEFEKTSFPCPKKYKDNLKELFGDYMQLPPEEERCGHGEVYLSFEKDDV